MISDRIKENDHRYNAFVRRIDASFNRYIDGPMFRTSAGTMFDYFLEHLPEEHRQYYNCNECRRFINKFGGLVSIDKDGRIHPVMWHLYEDYPKFFLEGVIAMREHVVNSFVTGAFYTDKTVLGTTESNGWSHFHVKVKVFSCIRPRSINTPFQEISEKLENYKLLSKALRKYSIESVKTAVTLLETGSLYRGDKVLPNAKWFKKVHILKPSIHLSRVYKNLIWREVAKAPEGFCHVSSNMLGTLLDDITDGLHIDDIQRRFKKKMNPSVGGYQRPSSAPSNGNIDQAEKIIDKMGIRKSLDRRFATLEEVPLIWSPLSDFLSIGRSVKNSGVFSHLKNNKSKSITKIEGMTPVILNWRDFKEDVLPNAEKILCYVSHTRLPLTAILTAVYMDAPPILKWDTEDNRSTLSTYVYTAGSYALSWDLAPNEYINVTGIINKPAMEEKSGIIFILEGCKDTKYKEAGSALFPEILKPELHSIRKTIEAYSRSKQITGFENSTACGMAFNNESPVTLKVTIDGNTVPYKIDRW
ncbi:MAG: hypothetical protein ABUK08_00190 [Candidatus Humimicrobiaceae bacterium]